MHVDNICILLYEWTGRVDLWNSLSSDDKLQLVLDVSVLVNAGVLPAKSQKSVNTLRRNCATVFIVDAFISKDCLKDVVARESATLSRFNVLDFYRF